MVTPIRLTLDGLPHTATVSATSVYAPQRGAGLVDATAIRLTLPVAGG